MLEAQLLLRESLARLLDAEGLPVVGQYGDPLELLARVDADRPEVTIVDLEEESGTASLSGLGVVRELKVERFKRNKL